MELTCFFYTERTQGLILKKSDLNKIGWLLIVPDVSDTEHITNHSHRFIQTSNGRVVRAETNHVGSSFSRAIQTKMEPSMWKKNSQQNIIVMFCKKKNNNNQ